MRRIENSGGMTTIILIVLYFVVKCAVKDDIKESCEEITGKEVKDDLDEILGKEAKRTAKKHCNNF